MLLHWDIGLRVDLFAVVGRLEIFGCAYCVGRLGVLGRSWLVWCLEMIGLV